MNEIKVIEEKFSRCPECRSFSVKQVELSFPEKIRDYFLPVSAYACENCAYRFAVHGSFSVKYKKNWIVVLSPLVLVAILVAVFLLPGDRATETRQPPPPIKQEQKAEEAKQEQQDITEPIETDTQETEKIPEHQEQQGEPGETTQPENTTPTTPEEQQEVPEETSPAETDFEITNDIILGDHNRFGVNWNTVENGVQITRLASGPFKTAGLLVGDVISEVDGEKIPTRDHLLTVRDEIFRERRDDAIIKVYRNNKPLYFRLVKTKKEKETPLNITGTTTPVKVFPATHLKQRSSYPDSESPENRWCFLRKDVMVKREPEQRVYLAGNSTATQKWAVDDQLIINGKTFTSLAAPYNPSPGTLPEEVKCDPLDITEMVPPGRAVQLKIRLMDHGIYWGNTDIYIVIK